MDKKDFYYFLPEDLIAQSPLEKRDQSKLMLLDKGNGEISHYHFYDIINFLNPGDCLVLNNSRVMPARLIGARSTGGAVEVLLLRDLGENNWECLTKPGKKSLPGTFIYFGDNELVGEVVSIAEGGKRIIHFNYSGIFMELLERLGKMPLPPYIKEELIDNERYQTVYSKEIGSSAAPTAGLHFTNDLISQIADKGVKICYITLHVGLGTFRPVKEEKVEDHLMHSELCSVSDEAASIINSVKKSGGKIIAVGTTSCRTLESFSNERGYVSSGSKWTDIFIYPGYKFKCIDSLITNFHLPESTLLMLVSALAGRTNILNAYNIAIEEKYRFFSFGDAMLIK